jgi:DNA-binding NtrC family response regulator
MANSNLILVVDDETVVRFGIREYLQTHGFRVREADSRQAAAAAFHQEHPDAVIVDYALPDGTALDLLAHIRQTDPEVPVIILTAHGSIELAVEAIQRGAANFLTKPIELSALQVILQRTIEAQRNRRQQRAQQSRDARQRHTPFIGTSRAIQRLEQEAELVRAAEAPVLLTGETGTGKGVLARWLHQSGPRAEEAFVDLNCACFSRELLESELFGHEKGAFTGALTRKLGLFEVAHRGTLLLDEIGDLDLQVQPKLLKAIEERRLRPVGSLRDRAIDAHLIAATHQNLLQQVREGRFRNDLFYRISAIPLDLPPLRERREDIVPLARHLLEGPLARRLPNVLSLAPDAERRLGEYPWPGNIRELVNVLERATLLVQGDLISVADLRFDMSAAQAMAGTAGGGFGGNAGSMTLAELETHQIDRVLAEERGNVERAAKRLGISRSNLYQRLKVHRTVANESPAEAS